MRNFGRNFTMRKADAPPPTGDWFRIENKEKSKAQVYIYDEIGYWGTTASDFAAQLNELDVDEIELHLNSPGGEVFDGLAIYNSLKNHKAKVTTYIDALAASAASFIALAGDEVIMARNAQMMIHDAIGLTYGNAEDMRGTADLLDKISDNIADIYAFNAGGDQADWREKMKATVWYSAFEAKEDGLVDTVLDSEDKDAEEATNKWDLQAVYGSAGRQESLSPAAVFAKLQIKNRVKEAHMTSSPSEPATPAPAEGTPAGETQPEGENTEAQTQDGNEAAVETTPPATPEPPASTGQPEARGMIPVMVNGAQHQVPATVATYLNSLESFRTETIQETRMSFVEDLARQGKIAATQIGNRAKEGQPASGLIAFALGLNDQQFNDWKASFDAVPVSGLFGNYGNSAGDASRPANGSQTEADVQARIQSLEQIVADHRRTGMSEDKLKEKASYKELMQLKSQQSTQTTS